MLTIRWPVLIFCHDMRVCVFMEQGRSRGPKTDTQKTMNLANVQPSCTN